MDLHEESCEGMDWFDGGEDREGGGYCECGKEPSDPTKLGEFLQ